MSIARPATFRRPASFGRFTRRLVRQVARRLGVSAQGARGRRAQPGLPTPPEALRVEGAEALQRVGLGDVGDPAQRAERRCGWFDSSQDLREGLSIREHAGTDAGTGAQLPLATWMHLHLAGWRPEQPVTA